MFLETETLSEALSYAKLKDLPKKYDPELGLQWILAVARVRKRNLMCAYSIVERRADGVIQYKKTFGKLSCIDSLLSIHPFMYLDPEAMKMAERTNRRTLSMLYSAHADQIIDSSDEEFKLFQTQYAMDLQLLNMNQEAPRFDRSIVDETEDAVKPKEEEPMKENEAVAMVQDEGECIIEVEDTKTVVKRAYKTRKQQENKEGKNNE